MPARGAWLYGSPVYRLALAGKAPTGLAAVPPDPWPGDAQAGAQLLQGLFSHAGHVERVDAPGGEHPGAPPAWIAFVNSFDWLRDLRAVGGDSARRQARALVAGWIDRNAVWNGESWAPEVLGARVANWIGQHDFFLASADDALRARVFDSLARQMRHLRRAVPGRVAGADLIAAIKGLVYGGLCLPGLEPAAERGLRLLERELPGQVAPDGGHVERSPTRQLQVLRHLIDIRACLRTARRPVPELLQHTIDRMAPALRFFRHGDGGLALFNDSREGEGILIDTVLGQADARGRPLKSAPHVGFERLTAGRSCILLDCGPPPPPGLDAHAFAGTLSFEMSVGRERLVVNCGASPAGTAAWRGALAATAAHSTLTLDDTNLAAVKEQGGIGRRPHRVEAERQDNNGAVLVDASHDGYRDGFGLIHRRRLYLADGGEDLRGEDTLEPAGGHRPGSLRAGRLGAGEPCPFAIRFHLHPAVQAGLADDGAAALLQLPGGSLWRLRAAGAALVIEDSIYFGTGDVPQPTRQLVLRGLAPADGLTVKWALKREPAPASGDGDAVREPDLFSPDH
jgi:uncharacterized heparinase superfamily protein